tara:strand:- start:569 stop:715 length:147 start_codon:yes stop_codon:yes gene_type:complete
MRVAAHGTHTDRAQTLIGWDGMEGYGRDGSRGGGGRVRGSWFGIWNAG